MVHSTQDGELLTSKPMCRPVLLVRFAVGLAVWLGSFSCLLVFCFTEVEGLCSTWGCRPTFDTLPYFHSLWLVGFLPPALFVAYVGPPKLIQRTAAAAFLLGFGVGICDTIVWAQRMAERGIHLEPLEYFQRWGYRLGTSVIDLPLLAFPVAAGVAWFIAHRRASQLACLPD